LAKLPRPQVQSIGDTERRAEVKVEARVVAWLEGNEWRLEAQF
jgi:hypothetical protein